MGADDLLGLAQRGSWADATEPKEDPGNTSPIALQGEDAQKPLGNG